jgi:spore coat protein U-like protein
MAASVLAFVLVFAPTSASAASTGSTTATFQVTATVTNMCTVTTQTLAFGNYNFTTASPANAANANILLTCTSGDSYTVALNAGSYTGATVNTRQMANGGNALGYQLYKDSGHTTVWGDGTLSSVTVSGTGTGAQQSLPVYGVITTGQIVPAGNYTDTITATITY